MRAYHHARVAWAATAVILVLVSMGLLPPTRAHGLTAGHSAKSPILIVEIVPLTGPDAAGPGLYEQSGATLGIRQINAHSGINGRPLEVIRADDRSTPTGAIAAFSRLVKAGRVTAAIVTNGSAKNQAMAPFIKRAGIPTIIGGQAPILTHEGDPWVFRTLPSGTYITRALSAFTVETLHLTRVAILYANDVSGKGANAELLADLKALGITPVVDQAFPSNYARDLTAQVLAIKKSGATALLSEASFASDFVLLARQLHQVGLHLTWLGTPALAGSETLRGAGALLYGTYAVTDYVPGQSPESAAFDRYSRAVLHLPGDFASAYAYDGVQILSRVIRKVGTNPQSIRRGILSIRGSHGVEGTYNFDRNGDGLRQDTMVQNVQGRLRVVKVLSF